MSIGPIYSNLQQMENTMNKSLEVRASKSILSAKTGGEVAGRGMVLAGGTAIALSVLAAFIPFVGVLGLGVILMVIGALFW